MIHLFIALLAAIVGGAAFVVNLLDGKIYWAFINLVLTILNLGFFFFVLEPMLK
jgi:hypothetical protein